MSTMISADVDEGTVLEPADDVLIDEQVVETVVEEINYDEFIAHLKTLTRAYIANYFEDKKYFCGGSIPQRSLLSEESVAIVISTPFEAGIDECYQILETTKIPEEFYDEISYMIWLLDSVKAIGTPKEFQAGLILLYLKFCRGRRIAPKELDIKHIVG